MRAIRQVGLARLHAQQARVPDAEAHRQVCSGLDHGRKRLRPRAERQTHQRVHHWRILAGRVLAQGLERVEVAVTALVNSGRDVVRDPAGGHGRLAKVLAVGVLYPVRLGELGAQLVGHLLAEARVACAWRQHIHKSEAGCHQGGTRQDQKLTMLSLVAAIVVAHEPRGRNAVVKAAPVRSGVRSAHVAGLQVHQAHGIDVKGRKERQAVIVGDL